MPPGAAGDPTVIRNATTEMMIDSGTGQAVRDERLTMRLSDLKSRIAGTLRALAAKGVTQ